MTLYARRVNQIDTENAFKIGPKIGQVEAAGHKVIKCNLGEPDFPLPAHIREEVKRQLDAGNSHYCDPQGIAPLRNAVAKHLSETRGLSITPEQVVVFPGAKPPIGFCQQTYCDPGDEIIYPSPGFPIYESFIHYVDAVPVTLHLQESKGFSLDGEDLAPLISDKTSLIFMNTPSNPTGGVVSKEQLEELADVIVKRAPRDVRVFSDEVYEDILFDGASHHSIASVPGMAERTVIVSGASKSYSWTGGRIGWAAFPTAEEAQVFKNLNINYFSCVPPYNQEGAREGLESDQTPAAIAEMVSAFQARRDVVVSGLSEIDGIDCQNPKGAFYVFPNIGGVCERLGVFDAYRALPDEVRGLTSPSTLFQMFLLFHHHVATVDRRSFGRLGTEKLHFVRLSIATAMEDLREAVARIGTAADDRQGFAAFIAAGKNLY
ncbi:MAG: pyridoxal phosphate-dependent aminotransferase [Planctomycetota bacterium]|jgi:aspartate/methionine/tyrosine aminotransferase